jgi:hypothetical protein
MQKTDTDRRIKDKFSVYMCFRKTIWQNIFKFPAMGTSTLCIRARYISSSNHGWATETCRELTHREKLTTRFISEQNFKASDGHFNTLHMLGISSSNQGWEKPAENCHRQKNQRPDLCLLYQ